jgi:hypothetical protein
MFLARILRDGSTLYLSRRTGHRWIVSTNRFGSLILYLNGTPVFTARRRAQIIDHLERGDSLFA